MRAHTTLARESIDREVDRYIATPGQVAQPHHCDATSFTKPFKYRMTLHPHQTSSFNQHLDFCVEYLAKL